MTVELQRITALLVDSVTEGLDDRRRQELDTALPLPTWPDLDLESFELAAAAIELACSTSLDPLPDSVRNRVLDQADRYFGSHRSAEAE